MQESIFAKLAEHGILGVIVFALATWIVMLHRELRDERAGRLDDVKEGHKAATDLQLAVSRQAETMREAMDVLKDRQQEIERERAAERAERERADARRTR